MKRPANGFTVSFFVFAYTACYTISPGPLSRTDRLAESEHVLRDSVVLRLDTAVTPTNPIVHARLLRHERIRVDFQEVRQAIREPDQFLNGLGAVFLIAAGGVAIWKGGKLRDPKTDSLSAGGAALTIGGAVSAVAGGGLIYWGFGNHRTLDAGQTVNGRQFRQEEVREDKAVPNSVLRVRLDELPDRTFTTDASGMVALDLVTDFGLKAFSAPRRVQFTFTAPAAQATQTLSVWSSAWTLPCIRTEAGRTGQVHEAARGLSRSLGSYGGNQTFRLQDTTQIDWFGIEYRGTTGWIPKLDASTCWFSPVDSSQGSSPRNPRE